MSEDEDHLEDCAPQMVCPVTGQHCMTEQDEFCEDYGCAIRLGIRSEMKPHDLPYQIRGSTG